MFVLSKFINFATLHRAGTPIVFITMTQVTKTSVTSRRRHSAKWWAHLAAFVCVVMWGVSFVSSKVLLINGMGAVEIYIYRFVIAYICIWAFSWRRILSHSWRDEIMFLLCGLCAGSLYFIAENTALEHTLVANVSLLTSLSPLLTALLAGLIYRNERPGKGMFAGSVIAFLGVACVIFNSSTELSFNPLGDLLSIAAAFSWAVYSLILRRISAHYDVWFITRKTFFYGIVTALPFMALSSHKADPMIIFSSGEVLANLLFLALGASLVAYIMWSVSVKELGPLKANNYMYLQAVVTMVVGAVALGEAITPIGVAGCTLILGGLWMGEYLTRRSSMRKGR